MTLWPALIVAPLLALADQGAAYALVTPGCAHQVGPWLHAVHAAFLAATLATLVPAWRAALGSRGRSPVDEGETGHRRSLMARAALAVGALSALVIAAIWIPQWVLSPCYG